MFTSTRPSEDSAAVRSHSADQNHSFSQLKLSESKPFSKRKQCQLRKNMFHWVRGHHGNVHCKLVDICRNRDSKGIAEISSNITDNESDQVSSCEECAYGKYLLSLHWWQIVMTLVDSLSRTRSVYGSPLDIQVSYEKATGFDIVSTLQDFKQSYKEMLEARRTHEHPLNRGNAREKRRAILG